MKPEPLLAACDELTRTMRYNRRQGFYYWPGGEQCGICTNGARRIARQFHGHVAGYQFEPNDSKEFIAINCGGHDFAIIGEFIVDWWAWDYEQSIPSPVLTIEEGLARGLYKPREHWVIFPTNDFRTNNVLCPNSNAPTPTTCPATSISPSKPRTRPLPKN